jgi:hypothetical protein
VKVKVYLSRFRSRSLWLLLDPPCWRPGLSHFDLSFDLGGEWLLFELLLLLESLESESLWCFDFFFDLDIIDVILDAYPNEMIVLVSL